MADITIENGDGFGIRFHNGEYDSEDSIEFCDGELEATAYSYHISSCGSVELTKTQTRKMYETMKKYYEREDSK